MIAFVMRTIIAGKNHQRITIQAGLFQVFEHPADITIQPCDHRRLTFVLIMPWAGAIAISIGSFAMALRDPDLNFLLAALNGVVTGIAPVLARQVAIAQMGLSDFNFSIVKRVY